MLTSLQLQVKILLLLWKVGLVDTFSVFKIGLNIFTQYGTIVLTSAVGNNSNFNSKLLLEPILGLGTALEFVRAAKTPVEQRVRIIALMSFFSTSASAVTTDAATNVAVGGAVVAKLSYMKAAMSARGGGTYAITNSIFLHPVKKLTIICGKAKSTLLVGPRYLAPIVSALDKVDNTTGLKIINTSAVIGFTIFGLLYLSKYCKQNQDREQSILVIKIDFDSFFINDDIASLYFSY